MKVKQHIPDEDFKVIKECLPLCTNIIQPQQKHILAAYNQMNCELDNLKLGRLDQHHPKVIEAYHKRTRAELNAWYRALGQVDNMYLSGGMRF